MSSQTRAFAQRPNLRFLKLEAKRRLAEGEFATLHEAQLAIAREHGLPSWAALKEIISTARPGEPGHALSRVRWLIARFRGADGAAWQPPAEDELREQFSAHFLSLVPPGTVISTLSQVAAELREDLVVTRAAPLGVRAQIGGLQLEAAAEAEPPHRLAGLRLYRAGQHVTDRRVTDPPGWAAGPVPDTAAPVAGKSFAELGLPGLVLAGTAGPVAGTAGPVADGGEAVARGGAAAGGEDTAWTVARGWASLERAEALRGTHRFPAYSITKLITATAVLRLVAGGRLALDDPANGHLRTVRLAGDAVTIRELLSHTGGVDSPGELFGSSIPSLASLTGPIMPCNGPRGTFSYSNGGYAMLGQLIADVTGLAYQEAAASLVLQPLGMASSSFPASWPDADAVTGYQLADDGTFEPVAAQVCTIPAAGGLWATGADLARFGLRWASLLPAGLAGEALRPHADRDQAGAQIGLGWLLHRLKDVAGHAGGGPGAATSLLVQLSTGRASVAMTSRLVPIEAVNARLLRPVA